MALTVKQILRNLYRFPGGAERISRVPQVKVTSLKRGVLTSRRAIRFVAQTRTPELSGGRVVLKPYASVVDYISPRNVKVACTCPDHWATWEFALARQGAADIQYSNGDPPDHRNPAQIAGACKHIVALVNQLVKLGHVNADFEIPQK